MANERWFLEALIESLRLMAADYETQVAALPQFVCVADEIATTYDETYLLVDQIVAAGLIDPAIVARFANIDEQTEAMSERTELWTLDTLRTAPEWQNLRTQARDILAALGESPRPPSLEWITYVGEGPPTDHPH